MRHPDGGGLTEQARARREQVRMRAADRFAEGAGNAQVARELRVSRMPAGRRHRALDAGGRDAPVSTGPGGEPCKPTDQQLKMLEATLEQGPAAHGWDQDQRWTPARIAELIWGMFGVAYTGGGVDYRPHRMGWSRRVPARRAAERDQGAIAAWREQTRREGKGPRHDWTPGCAVRTGPARGGDRPPGVPGDGAGPPRW
jgi:transposase